MKPRFQRRKQLSSLADINLTPLIDLAFTLLIIFMITAPLLQQSIDVNLPTESERHQVSKPELSHTVTIDRALQLFWDERPIADSELNEQLRVLSFEAPSTVISIRADAQVPYQAVISVVDKLKTHNLQHLSLETQAR